MGETEALIAADRPICRWGVRPIPDEDSCFTEIVEFSADVDAIRQCTGFRPDLLSADTRSPDDSSEPMPNSSEPVLEIQIATVRVGRFSAPPCLGREVRRRCMLNCKTGGNPCHVRRFIHEQPMEDGERHEGHDGSPAARPDREKERDMLDYGGRFQYIRSVRYLDGMAGMHDVANRCFTAPWGAFQNNHPSDKLVQLPSTAQPGLWMLSVRIPDPDGSLSVTGPDLEERGSHDDAIRYRLSRDLYTPNG